MSTDQAFDGNCSDSNGSGRNGQGGSSNRPLDVVIRSVDDHSCDKDNVGRRGQHHHRSRRGRPHDDHQHSPRAESPLRHQAKGQSQAQHRRPSTPRTTKRVALTSSQTPSSPTKSPTKSPNKTKSRLSMRRKQQQQPYLLMNEAAPGHRFSKTQFLTTCRKHVYSMADLKVLNLLNAPVWIFDGKYKCMRFGNQAACKFWSAKHMEELMSRDYASDMSETTNRSNIAWLDRFSKHPTAQDNLTWTYQPTHGDNPGARYCSINITGIYIPHPDDETDPHLCLLVVVESVKETKAAGSEAAEAAKAIVVYSGSDGDTNAKVSAGNDHKGSSTNNHADADRSKPGNHGADIDPSDDQPQENGTGAIAAKPQPDEAQPPQRKSKAKIEDEAAESIRRMETLRHLPVVARRFDMTGRFMDQNQEAFALFGEPTEHNPDSETSQDDLENNRARDANDTDANHDDSPTDDGNGDENAGTPTTEDSSEHDTKTDAGGSRQSKSRSKRGSIRGKETQHEMAEGSEPMHGSLTSTRSKASGRSKLHKSLRRDDEIEHSNYDHAGDPSAQRKHREHIRKHRKRRRELKKRKQRQQHQQDQLPKDAKIDTATNSLNCPLKKVSTCSTRPSEALCESVPSEMQQQRGKQDSQTLQQVPTQQDTQSAEQAPRGSDGRRCDDAQLSSSNELSAVESSKCSSLSSFSCSCSSACSSNESDRSCDTSVGDINNGSQQHRSHDDQKQTSQQLSCSELKRREDQDDGSVEHTVDTPTHRIPKTSDATRIMNGSSGHGCRTAAIEVHGDTIQNNGPDGPGANDRSDGIASEDGDEDYYCDIDESSEEEDEEKEEKPCDFVAQFIDHDKGQQILQEVVDSKGQHDVSSEAQLQTIEGIKWFSIKIRQVKDPVTSQSVMIYSARDISDIMQAAKDEADRQNMRKSEFFAVMAHEIRTPLHQVVGFIELLASTPLNIEQTDFVTMLQSSTNALMAIINDLLDFTKLEAGKMKLETIPFEVRNVLDGSVAAVLPQAEDRGLELKCDIGRGIPVKLLGDPNRLRQIVLNMLTNAIKFTSNGSVTTSVRLIHVMTDVNAHVNTEAKNGDAMNDNSAHSTTAAAVANAMSGNNSVVIGAAGGTAGSAVDDKANATTNDDNGGAAEASLTLDGEKGRRSPRRSLSGSPSGSRSRRKNRGTQSASSHSRSQSQMARKSKTSKNTKNTKNNTKTGKKKSKNGVKAMPQTNREQVVLRFSVTDTGIGMTPDQCERIFNAYQQADASVARNFGGTGLGLAICKSLVKGMGGAIGVDSAPGEGTTFWFEIPYKRHVNTRCAATGMSVGSVVGDGLDDVIHDAIHDAIHDDVIDNGDGDDDAVVAQDDVDGADRDPSQGVHLDDADDVRNVVVSADQIGRPHTIIQVPKQGSASRGYTDDDGDDDQGGDRDREDGNETRKGVSNVAIVKSDQPQPLSQPLSQPPADPQARPQPSAPTQPSTPKKPKTDELRILVAEDNKINQKVIRNMLKRLGHVVTIVENGEQAVAQAFGTTDVDDIAMLDGNNTNTDANDGTSGANGGVERPPFDIVLMDWQMPVMDGIDATKEIRTRGLSERDLPIVGLTASIQSIDWGHIGMNDCLKKPVRMADLKTSLLKNARTRQA